MMLLLPGDRKRYDDFTRIAARHTKLAMELMKAKLAGLMVDGQAQARRAAEQYLEYLQWPPRQMEYSFAFRVLQRHAGRSKISSILDVGSGPSAFPTMLAEAFNSEVTAADMDGNQMEFMRGLGFPGCTFMKADMRSLPFADRRFDAVCCVSVLEHVEREDGLSAIAEMLRVVKEDGIVVLTVDYCSLGAAWWALKKIFRLQSAARMLFRGGFGPVLNAAAAPGPYTWSDVKSLRARLRDFLIGEPDPAWARLSLGRIRGFWRDHWQAGFHYDARKGRDYTSIGLALSPSPEARLLHADAPCAGGAGGRR